MSASQPFEPERPRKRAPWGVIALVLLTGLALIRNGSGEFDTGPPQPAPVSAADRRGPVPVPPSGVGEEVAALPFSRAERVTIPAIRVDAPMMPVNLDAQGWVDAPPPEDPNLAGWFSGAVSPGEKGTAVVVGHVDNTSGPAVFYGLGALEKGNRVEVHRADGRTAVFEVYGIEVFQKEDFPGDQVYGDTGYPEIRVITCGGGFTKQDGYAGNVVVFARMTGVR
ncbi:class F sortase [Streptomyces sp. JNUCC 64]